MSLADAWSDPSMQPWENPAAAPRPAGKTTTAGDVFAIAERLGLAVEELVPAGSYLVEVMRVSVIGGVSLSPVYRIIDGPKHGTLFTATKCNCTPKGIRRTKEILKRWGVDLHAYEELEELAEVWKGRKAHVRVKNEIFNGYEMCAIDERTIRLQA